MIMMKRPRMISARYNTISTAEKALKALTETLSAAEKEATLLFERQGGMAESRDIAAIYTKFGFLNDCGWQQTRPIVLRDTTLFWELPEGMVEEEAAEWLTAFGPISIDRDALSDEEDLLGLVPHPAALFLSELDEMQDFDDDEQPSRGEGSEGLEKKTIH